MLHSAFEKGTNARNFTLKCKKDKEKLATYCDFPYLCPRKLEENNKPNCKLTYI